MRNLCDEATDSGDFIKASEEQMKKHTFLCEEAIKNRQPQKMVDNTSAIARLANRVLLVAKQESDNSEDPSFIDEVNRASDSLQNSVPPMVTDAKSVAVNPADGQAVSRWRDSNKAVSIYFFSLVVVDSFFNYLVRKSIISVTSAEK